MQGDMCREASKLIQCVMEGYISEDPRTVGALPAYSSPDMLIVGTGRYEFYTSPETPVRGLEKDQEETRGIRLMMRDTWYEAKMITENARAVYGEFKAREAGAGDKGATVDINTRITASVHREEGGGLVIDSLRRSIPYIYQQEGEYYLRTFANPAEEALKWSAILERHIQLDSMTSLHNRKYTEIHVICMLSQDRETSLLFAIDMDGFKKVNDTYGYLRGGELSKKTASVMAEHMPPSAIVGRVGGDEFMMSLSGPYNRGLGEKAARGPIREISCILSQVKLEQSCSVGITVICRKGETFKHAYRRAGQALYCAKSLGRNAFCWAEDLSPG